jgi:hypothetical protein
LFEIGKLASRRAAVDPARGHGHAAVRNGAIQQPGEIAALGVIGRRFPDHGGEFFNDGINAGPGDIQAG